MRATDLANRAMLGSFIVLWCLLCAALGLLSGAATIAGGLGDLGPSAIRDARSAGAGAHAPVLPQFPALRSRISANRIEVFVKLGAGAGGR